MEPFHIITLIIFPVALVAILWAIGCIQRDPLEVL